CTLQGACQSQRAMPPYCRGSKHQKNGLAPLEERKRLCDPPNLPNLISFICLFPINMQPLALFLRKEPGGLSSISPGHICPGFLLLDHLRKVTISAKIDHYPESRLLIPSTFRSEA